MGLRSFCQAAGPAVWAMATAATNAPKAPIFRSMRVLLLNAHDDVPTNGGAMPPSGGFERMSAASAPARNAVEYFVMANLCRLALTLLGAVTLYGQPSYPPPNDLPNPYKTVRDWAQL